MTYLLFAILELAVRGIDQNRPWFPLILKKRILYPSKPELLAPIRPFFQEHFNRAAYSVVADFLPASDEEPKKVFKTAHIVTTRYPAYIESDQVKAAHRAVQIGETAYKFLCLETDRIWKILSI
jgi:hypothetical protein